VYEDTAISKAYNYSHPGAGAPETLVEPFHEWDVGCETFCESRDDCAAWEYRYSPATAKDFQFCYAFGKAALENFNKTHGENFGYKSGVCAMEEPTGPPTTPVPESGGTTASPAPTEYAPELSEETTVSPGTTTTPITTEPAIDCKTRMDMVLLLDSSMSVNGKARQQIEHFATDMIEALARGEQDSQVGVIWFARDVGVVSDLTAELSALPAKVQAFEEDIGHTTETALALITGREMLAKGGRADAEKVILLVYDGKPTDVMAWQYENYTLEDQAEAIKASGTKLNVAIVQSKGVDRAEFRSREWSHRTLVSSPWEQHLHAEESLAALVAHAPTYVDAACYPESGHSDEKVWAPEGLPWETLSCVEDVCGMFEGRAKVDAAIEAMHEWQKLGYPTLTEMPTEMDGLSSKFDCIMEVEDVPGGDHPWTIKNCNSDDLRTQEGFKDSWLDPSPGIKRSVILVEQDFHDITSGDGVWLACPAEMNVIGGGCESTGDSPAIGVSKPYGIGPEGASSPSGWQCSRKGLKNPGEEVNGGSMTVRALCSEKVIVTGTTGMRSFSTKTEDAQQACPNDDGRVIGGGCATMAVEDTTWVTLEHLEKPTGDPVFGEIKPVSGLEFQCGESTVYRMTAAICIQAPLVDDIYEIAEQGVGLMGCRDGDFLVGGGCSGPSPLVAATPVNHEGTMKWKCEAQDDSAKMTTIAVCMANSPEQVQA
jgi:uncharacterized protein YegL